MHIYNRFYQNKARFIENMTKYFGLLFSGIRFGTAPSNCRPSDRTKCRPIRAMSQPVSYYRLHPLHDLSRPIAAVYFSLYCNIYWTAVCVWRRQASVATPWRASEAAMSTQRTARSAAVQTDLPEPPVSHWHRRTTVTPYWPPTKRRAL